jgi:hypothetical protein
MTEAIQQAASAEIGKHRRLLHTGRDGRILSALMLPQMWLAKPAGYGVLTTTGRKTGRPRRPRAALGGGQRHWPCRQSHRRFGLRGMRARVTQVGGTVTVSPTPSGGTTVTIEVPA